MFIYRQDQSERTATAVFTLKGDSPTEKLREPAAEVQAEACAMFSWSQWVIHLGKSLE